MANKYLLNKPSSAFDINSQMMRGWFNDVDVFTRRLSDITATKTADFTVQDALFYPVDSTAGAIVVNLPASLGNRGRQVVFKQIAGSNTVTITPSGTDTIGGAATLVLTANSVVHYIADGGTDWIDISQGGSSGMNSQAFTATGAFTFNVPSGVNEVLVTLQGAGASGARDAATSGGGGAGETIRRYPYAVTSGGTVSGSIGTGGAARSANGVCNAGGASTFGTLTAAGGLAGTAVANGSAGGGVGGAPESVAVSGVRGTGPTFEILGGSSGAASGNIAGPCGLFSGGLSHGVRGGGAASYFATGGEAGTAGAGAPSGGSLGSGGGGSTTGNSGAGGNGYAFIEW